MVGILVGVCDDLARRVMDVAGAVFFFWVFEESGEEASSWLQDLLGIVEAAQNGIPRQVREDRLGDGKVERRAESREVEIIPAEQKRLTVRQAFIFEFVSQPGIQ